MTKKQDRVLRTENLQCMRDDRVLFEALFFQLTAGEILQVAGPNGSGKTSLLRILCGLMLPTEGTVFWCDEDIQSARVTFGEQMRYLGHSIGLKTGLTPLENLAMAAALNPQPDGMDSMTALDQVGLYGFEDVAVHMLSAGQQRRVALARLLLGWTPLWILDEPFTALDRDTVALVEHLMDVHAEQGGMVVLTSHQPVNCRQVRQLVLCTG